MKVIQIAIEKGEDQGRFTPTFLWALTDTGRIFVRVAGEWQEEEPPRDTPPQRRKE